MSDMEEQWKDVVGFEGFYKVSNYGKVFSQVSKRNIKIKIERNGYARAHLWRNGVVTCFLVHKLVAESFIGPRPKGLDINHIDAKRSNNFVKNLEYITRKENVRLCFIGKKRGAYKDKFGYRARIYYNGKHHHIKTTKTKEEAYQAFFDEYKKIYGVSPW
jgi:hypothetical protein